MKNNPGRRTKDIKPLDAGGLEVKLKISQSDLVRLQKVLGKDEALQLLPQLAQIAFDEQLGWILGTHRLENMSDLEIERASQIYALLERGDAPDFDFLFRQLKIPYSRAMLIFEALQTIQHHSAHEQPSGTPQPKGGLKHPASKNSSVPSREKIVTGKGKSTKQPVLLQPAQTRPAGINSASVGKKNIVTYVLGNDLFDESFSFDSEHGKFLGEFGVGISEKIGEEKPNKVSALEIWLFDKNDIKTSTTVLMSEFAGRNKEIQERLKNKGKLMVVTPNTKGKITTATIHMSFRVTELKYGKDPSLPPKSYFERLTIELSPRPIYETDLEKDDSLPGPQGMAPKDESSLRVSAKLIEETLAVFGCDAQVSDFQEDKRQTRFIIHAKNMHTPKGKGKAKSGDLQVARILSHQQDLNLALAVPQSRMKVLDAGKGEIQLEIPKSDDQDDLSGQALSIFQQHENPSISLLQRKLRIGYSRAKQLFDQIAGLGIADTANPGQQGQETPNTPGRKHPPQDRSMQPFQVRFSGADPLFYKAFPIQDGGAALGEFGVNVCETVRQKGAVRVTAFEVWLTDQAKRESISQIIATKDAWDHPARLAELQKKGKVASTEQGNQWTLKLGNIRLNISIAEVNFLATDESPRAYLQSVVLDLQVEISSAPLTPRPAPAYHPAIQSEQGREGSPSPDQLLSQAIGLAHKEQRVSVSMLQRRLRIGYTRAAHLMDQMEDMGIVGPAEGEAQTRPVLA